jgi:hypothetical protein
MITLVLQDDALWVVSFRPFFKASDTIGIKLVQN